MFSTVVITTNPIRKDLCCGQRWIYSQVQWSRLKQVEPCSMWISACWPRLVLVYRNMWWTHYRSSKVWLVGSIDCWSVCGLFKGLTDKKNTEHEGDKIFLLQHQSQSVVSSVNKWNHHYILWNQKTNKAHSPDPYQILKCLMFIF